MLSCWSVAKASFTNIASQDRSQDELPSQSTSFEGSFDFLKDAPMLVITCFILIFSQ